MCKDCGCEEGMRRAYFGDEQAKEGQRGVPPHGHGAHEPHSHEHHDHDHDHGHGHGHSSSCSCGCGSEGGRKDSEDRWEGRRERGGPPRPGGSRGHGEATAFKLPEIHIHLNLGDLGVSLAGPRAGHGHGLLSEGGRGRHRRGPGRQGCHHHHHGERPHDHDNGHDHGQPHGHENGQPRGHDHGHPHGHERHRSHENDHACEAPAVEERRSIEVEQRVLAHNDALAAENRRWLSERGVASVNLISSPGSGKTELLVKTLEGLKARGEVSTAVLVGDQQTDNDAQRLEGRGARVHQIETLASCHLNAEQIAMFLPEVLPDLLPEQSSETDEEGKQVATQPRLLFVENVGNLVCPAAFDLGEQQKIALLSVTEGEDKPLKYPVLFHDAPVALITKIDLLPHLDVDLEQIRQNLRKIRPDVRIFELSAKSGEGLEEWLDWLSGLPLAGASD